MDRGVIRIADLVLIASLLVMSTLVVRMFWRGYRGSSTRPGARTVIAVVGAALVGVAAAIVVWFG